MPATRFAAALALAWAAAAPAFAAAASVRDDTRDVPHLIAAYHAAVVGHDAPRLATLFAPQGTAWFTVLSDEALAHVRAAKPDTPKARPGSVQGFVDMVAASRQQLDPVHSRLQVRSDGVIATVTFDFRFMIDGREQNRGAESWQLVKGDEGWRIVSIAYSSTPLGTPPSR